MSDVEITAEMVMQVVSGTQALAGRIAAYTNHRYAGLHVTDAARKTGVSEVTGRRYERTLPVLRERLGLPEVPVSRTNYGVMAQLAEERGQRGGHQAQHVARGVSSPDCPLCQQGGGS